jgi:hypothetical protein
MTRHGGPASGPPLPLLLEAALLLFDPPLLALLEAELVLDPVLPPAPPVLVEAELVVVPLDAVAPERLSSMPASN